MKNNESLYLIMLVAVKPTHKELFATFIQKNAPLLQKYKIELLHSIEINAKGQLLDENIIPQPDFVNVFEIESMENFIAYTQDPEYTNLSAMRAESTLSVIGYFTKSSTLPEQNSPTSHKNQRLYFLGLANFIGQDAEGIDNFNKQAIESGLFTKYDMYIELQLIPLKSIVIVGDGKITTPDRIQLFHVGSQEKFKQYASDSGYKTLAPLRDKTLTKYDFFMGKVNG